jgi:hypothetical protein
MTDAPRGLDVLGDADFARHLNEPFAIRLSATDTLAVTLAEVTPHPHLPHHTGARRGFSLVFQSAEAGHLRQGTYPLEHAQLGTLELFLVPIGPKDGGMRYEAVFN